MLSLPYVAHAKPPLCGWTSGACAFVVGYTGPADNPAYYLASDCGDGLEINSIGAQTAAGLCS